MSRIFKNVFDYLVIVHGGKEKKKSGERQGDRN